MTSTPMQALIEWCACLLDMPADSLALQSVAGDASFRRYYRLSGCSPARIVVHAPPDKEKNEEFTFVASLLRSAGVRAPEVLAHDRERGFLLIEDFGDRLLRPALYEHSVDGLYGLALETLLRIQAAPTRMEHRTLPDYSRQLLEQELRLFPEWYLGPLLGLDLSPAEQGMLRNLFDRLMDEALSQPQVLVHRDFHSRNLMLLGGDSLGVIDFQDAVRGPLTYDPVSLLRDCYVRWPAERVRAWALGYAERAVSAGLMPAVGEAVFLRWFDWMGLQRHIKVLGIFARLWLRDGKPGYLEDLPLVMRYTQETAAAYPELLEFADWFDSRVLPVAMTQPWYRSA